MPGEHKLIFSQYSTSGSPTHVYLQITRRSCQSSWVEGVSRGLCAGSEVRSAQDSLRCPCGFALDCFRPSKLPSLLSGALCAWPAPPLQQDWLHHIALLRAQGAGYRPSLSQTHSGHSSHHLSTPRDSFPVWIGPWGVVNPSVFQPCRSQLIARKA